MLGHEYGWTPDYVLDHLTRGQIEAFVEAISRRIAIQEKAFRRDKTDDQMFDESDPGSLAGFGIEVK